MATITVNTTVDELDGSIVDGDVSLRDAVAAANAAAGADTIAFDASIFNGEAADILRLTQGQIVITDALTIDGGAAGVTITGDADGDDVVLAGGVTDVDASLVGDDRLDDNSRIFDASADLTLDCLTLTGGETTAEGEGGGAVRGTAALTLTDSTVSGNRAEGYGASGGGISAIGDVTLTNSVVFGNRVAGYSGGGGIYSGGDVTLANSEISDNRMGDEGRGGGIYGLGNVTVTESTVSRNSVGDRGSGGGISARGDVTVRNSTVSDNRGDYESGGGGISGGTVTVTNSTVTGNYSDFGFGGGIRGGTVTVTDSTVSGNYGRAGGGIRGGTVTVTNSTVSDNGGGGEGGGGIYGGTVTVTNSTVSRNNAEYAGGGIYGDTVTVMNSTISGNSVAGYSYTYGGGIRGGTITLTNSTVSGNCADSRFPGAEGGGISGSGTLTLTNSLVLGNATISAGVGGDEVQAGAIVRTGGNIVGTDVFSGETDIGDTSAEAVFAATTEISPGVFAGVLADNGGPTETIALRPDPMNPAIGGADPATATPTDQRGVARDADPDLGAFEAEPVGPPAPFRIEAEALVLVSGFKVENLGAASGDKVIKSPNPSVEARASFTFTGQDGAYDLDLGYFDEKDGRSELSIFVDGLEVDSFLFRENLGSTRANAETHAVRHVAEIELDTGDVVELVGHGNRDEPLRIDYIDFTPVDELIS